MELERVARAAAPTVAGHERAALAVSFRDRSADAGGDVAGGRA
jgi:hypothetical protein